jgi:general secretion pathway protein M
MKEWLDELEPRERFMVSLAAVFVVFAVFYFGLWKPVILGKQTLATSVETQQRVLAQLQQLKGRVQAPEDGQAAAVLDRNESLVVVVDTTLRTNGLYQSLKRSQPTSTNGIRVELENVAFDKLVVWLGQLGNNYDLQVQTGSFSKPVNAEPGRVNSTLILERVL